MTVYTYPALAGSRSGKGVMTIRNLLSYTIYGIFD